MGFLECFKCKQQLEVDWYNCPKCKRVVKCSVCDTRITGKWEKCPNCKTEIDFLNPAGEIFSIYGVFNFMFIFNFLFILFLVTIFTNFLGMPVSFNPSENLGFVEMIFYLDYIPFAGPNEGIFGLSIWFMIWSLMYVFLGFLMGIYTIPRFSHEPKEMGIAAIIQSCLILLNFVLIRRVLAFTIFLIMFEFLFGLGAIEAIIKYKNVKKLKKKYKAKVPTPIAEKKLVSCKRQFEYFSGFVRIKLKIINSSDSVVTNIRINLDVPDSFKLMKVEPLDNFKERLITIPTIQSKLEKTLNVYLEPLVCGKERIYGDIKYLDASGTQYFSTITPLEVQVICPMFFTEEEANIAMVKNLMEKKLHVKDERSYGIPRGLEASLLNKFLKESIQRHHVKLVHESTGTEPTFEATLYYLGKTKIKKNYFIIQGIVSQKNLSVRIIIASDNESQLVGLLAEIGSFFRQKVLSTRIITSESELISLRCPNCAAPLEYLPESGDRCPYCDGVMLF